VSGHFRQMKLHTQVTSVVYMGGVFRVPFLWCTEVRTTFYGGVQLLGDMKPIKGPGTTRVLTEYA